MFIKMYVILKKLKEISLCREHACWKPLTIPELHQYNSDIVQLFGNPYFVQDNFRTLPILTSRRTYQSYTCIHYNLFIGQLQGFIAEFMLYPNKK